jgi:hypothetical protein
MYQNNSDIIAQYIQLSKTFEKTFKMKMEFFEAHNIYLELLEVQRKLAEAENSFSKLN